MAISGTIAKALRLRNRDLQPELMDESELNETDHRFALDGLRRLNSASGACHQLSNEIVAYCRTQGTKRVRVLDIASGGGDIPMRLWSRAKKNGIDLQIRGIDTSATACAYATERCESAAGAIVFDLTILSNYFLTLTNAALGDSAAAARCLQIADKNFAEYTVQSSGWIAKAELCVLGREAKAALEALSHR